MNPVFILIPAAALVVAPRWWVGRVLKKHNQDDEPGTGTARELARELLDSRQLQAIKVEITDLGDHYDPLTRTVRLTRDKADRRTLTALTAAAHEVAHAIQHAAGYPPFEWHARLSQIARVAGQGGTVLLLSVPAAALLSRQRMPSALLGGAALAMLSTGVLAQLSAIPVELDASFRRALPMLSQGHILEEKLGDARIILLASSLTYVASSLVGVVHVWPWINRPLPGLVSRARLMRQGKAHAERNGMPGTRAPAHRHTAATPERRTRTSRNLVRGGGFERIFRKTAKPLVRQWLLASGR